MLMLEPPFKDAHLLAAISRVFQPYSSPGWAANPAPHLLNQATPSADAVFRF